MHTRYVVGLLSFFFIIAGCPSSDDDDTTSEEVEGDEAGECSDGADNDQDGFFDCDDEGCENSPDCEGDDDDAGDDDAADDDAADDDAADDDAADDDDDAADDDDDAADDDTGDDDDDAAACGSYGGYYASDGLGGLGCWFAADAGASCTTECSTHGLSCDPSNWNDFSDSSICTAITGEPQAGVNNPDGQPWTPYLYTPGGTSHGCYYSNGAAQSCASIPGSSPADAAPRIRICVCSL